jgi:hypothetical protein
MGPRLYAHRSGFSAFCCSLRLISAVSWKPEDLPIQTSVRKHASPDRDDGASTGALTNPCAGARDPNLLISVIASGAAAIIALTAVDAWQAVSVRPWTFLAFCALTVGLQLVQVEVYNRGATSFAQVGLLAMGFVFSVGASMIMAAMLGLLVLIIRKGRLNRAVFDAAQFALAAGAAALVFHAFGARGWSPAAQIAPALAAGAVYMLVNVTLLCSAMSMAEEGRPF